MFKLKCSYIIDYIFRFRNGSTSGNHCIHLNNFSSSSSSHNSYCSSRICIHTILPRWMLEKPELVCPSDSLQKGEVIGSGQYGMVYKGSYNHGTARFVYDIFSCHYFKIKSKLLVWLQRIMHMHFICLRLSLQWLHMKISDNLNILQYMDTDDDLDTNGRKLTAERSTTIFLNELISKLTKN